MNEKRFISHEADRSVGTHAKYDLYRESEKNGSSCMKLKKSLYSVILTIHKLYIFSHGKLNNRWINECEKQDCKLRPVLSHITHITTWIARRKKTFLLALYFVCVPTWIGLHALREIDCFTLIFWQRPFMFFFDIAFSMVQAI